MRLDVILQFNIAGCAGESTERAVEQIFILLEKCEELLLSTLFRTIQNVIQSWLSALGHLTTSGHPACERAHESKAAPCSSQRRPADKDDPHPVWPF
jgi:hypothetical protein